MSKYIPGNQKHLTLEDRLYVEKELSEGKPFKDIARYLCKDPSTISKEVKKHRATDTYHKGNFNNTSNFCVKRYHCRKRNVCDKLFLCDKRCASCPVCNQHCKDFVKEECLRLEKAPYVCNGCDKAINKCPISQKYFYDARFADREYHQELSSSREGINMTKRELHEKNEVVSPLICQGQSPYQIAVNHPELGMSVRTIYNYIDKSLFTARNVDLKRKTKFKPRKVHKTQITDREAFVGRTYADYCSLDEAIRAATVEMDTVLSSRDSKKTLLTFYICKCELFLAFLLNRCTKGAVRNVIDRLEERLGTYGFCTLFPLILTDRGGEFGDPERLENSAKSGMVRTSIYYCDPMRSGQKGGIEEAHSLLRQVLPKGTSFEFLTQWDVNLIVNHINSTPREKLGGCTPYEAALEAFGEEPLKALQLRPIPPDEVNLTPKLIRYNK